MKKINEKEIAVQFENPSNNYRPLQIIHGYFPHGEENIKAYLQRAKEKGMGGFVTNVGNKNGSYLCDEEEFADLKKFITAAVDDGFKIWLYDEEGYPSGSAYNLVIKDNPEYQVRGLCCQSIKVKGGVGSAMLYAGEVISAKAYPIIIDSSCGEEVISAKNAVDINAAGRMLSWSLKKGEWLICAVIARKVNFLTMHNVPYVNLLNPDVTEKFISVTHQRYLEKFGEELFSKIEAVFTDEPGFPCHGCSSIFDERYATVAWDDTVKNMIDDFSQRAIGIFYDTDLGDTDIRVEFHSALSHLYEKNYFGKIYDFCEKHGIKSTGHLYGEENLAMQIALNGELFGLHRNMQMPGVDRLYCTNPTNVIPEKSASSASHLSGRNVSMSESSSHFEGNWWFTTYTTDDMINSTLYQYQLGLTYSALYYDYNQPDEERKRYEIAVGRASYFNSLGQHSAPILFHIPTEGAYRRFLPRNRKFWHAVLTWNVEDDIPQSLHRLELSFDTLQKQLLDAQYDYDLIDTDGLNAVKVKDGKFTTDFESFELLVIYDCTLTDELKSKIEDYSSLGGKTVIIKVEEDYSPLAKDLKLRFGNFISLLDEKNVFEVLEESINPVIEISPKNKNIRVRHSTDGERDIYFLHNRSDEDITLSVENIKCRELFDLSDGSVTKNAKMKSVTVKAKSAVFIVS